ncbi:hypothetical protein [Leifsonia sp. Root112D2]|jgi:hypothetical protein|uniref:hypothetical protein n=1 Tax=Leifsonia sp. Root112D2 TaxID=1736426 RepID=UPI0006F31B60|nr:hypothetical protein [Leifsonia sp. Root112D2]KQV05989.1 hypothetical protein ASC63_00330 [Leifsonia sp. Root112D2]
MRWDNLFDDLESQLEQELGAEEVDLRAEEERLRLGRISLRERISALTRGLPPGSYGGISVQLVTGLIVNVRPGTFGKDWFAADLIEESRRDSQCVLPLGAIAAVLLTPAQARQSLEPETRQTSAPQLVDRIGIAFVLRDLCRRRAGVEVHTRAGILHGTIDRVGRDHLDLAVHESGVARRASAVAQLRVIPLEQLCLVRL